METAHALRPPTRLDAGGDWQNSAQCRGADGEIFFTPGATQEFRAKAVCRSCPVRWECLAYALKHRVEHGIWGGLSERERRRVLNRTHPLSWDPETAMRVVS